MDKRKLYSFSLELRQLLNEGKIEETEKKLKQAALEQNELDFIFMCLHSNGYDPTTDSFVLFESDNSAFLSLVNLVQVKLSSKK